MTIANSRESNREPPADRVRGTSPAPAPAALAAKGVQIEARGRMPCGAADEARRRIAELARFAPGPILLARVSLTGPTDPAASGPAHATALLDVDGRSVHAQSTGRSMHEAIAGLADRLWVRLRCLDRGPGEG